MELSSKIKEVSTSPTLAITAQAKKLKNEGKDIISLGAGEPDFETPKHIKKAAIEAIRDGFTTYTSTVGIKELREAIINDFKTEKGIEYNSEQVIVSPGAKYSLFLALQAILNQGDEVILPAPFWVSYPEQIKFAGAKVVTVDTKEENDFKITAKELKEAISSKTKALILNTPGNPTGSVYTKKELEKIAKVALEEDIFIISDEIYQKISYDKKAISIASLGKKIKEQTIVIDGVSKAYAMTGWRIGYAVGPKEIIDAMERLQSHSTSNANSIAQKASLAALSKTQKPVEKMLKSFKKRRDIMVDGINEIKGLKAKKPAGAFYLFVNAKEILGDKIKNSQQLAELLLNQAGVATIPGSAFAKEGYLRLSYATGEDEIKEALKRIKEFLD